MSEVSGTKMTLTLVLERDGKTLTVACGDIAFVELGVHTHGFSGAVEFWVDKDEQLLFDTLHTPSKLIKVQLGFKTPNAEEVEPLELDGILTQKQLTQEVTNPDENRTMVQNRVWYIEFQDPLRRVWSEHYPMGIFTEKSMEDVLREYLPGDIKLTVESEAIKEVRPLIALGLGDKNNKANFYDFLVWHLREMDAILDFDYKTKTYIIRDEKEASGEPIDLSFDPCMPSVEFPEHSRNDRRIYNSFASSPLIKDVPGEEVFEKASRDYLHTTPIQKETETHATEVKPKPNSFEHRLKMPFCNFPLVELCTNNLYTFTHPAWSEDLFFKKHTYRLYHFHLTLGQKVSSVTKNFAPYEFGMGLTCNFELKEEVLVNYPPTAELPRYPFPHQGIIFSEKGPEDHITFDVKEDGETKQLYYTVELPAAENQHVKAPFQPTYSNGQDYYPLLKGQRVWVLFELFTARIKIDPEWLPFAQLPKTKQGNRTFFAPKLGEDAYTYMQHVEDGTLTLEFMKKSGEQFQVLRFKEGVLEVIVYEGEKADPQSHIFIDEKSITIQSQNKDSKQTQMVKLEPNKITSLVEEGGDKSTYVQTPTSITIECQEFTLKTDKTSLESTEGTTCKGKTVDVEGSSGVSIKDGSKVTTEAPTVDVNGSTTNIAGAVNLG